MTEVPGHDSPGDERVEVLPQPAGGEPVENQDDSATDWFAAPEPPSPGADASSWRAYVLELEKLVLLHHYLKQTSMCPSGLQYRLEQSGLIHDVADLELALASSSVRAIEEAFEVERLFGNGFARLHAKGPPVGSTPAERSRYHYEKMRPWVLGEIDQTCSKLNALQIPPALVQRFRAQVLRDH